jgi:hypothetical protein
MISRAAIALMMLVLPGALLGCGGGGGRLDAAARGPLRPAEPFAPRLRIAPSGPRYHGASEAALERAAERLSTSLVRRLYSPGRRPRIEAASRELRRAIAQDPPFVPDPLRGTPARVRAIELFPQTSALAGGALQVLDRRSLYTIDVQFARRGGRWLAVYLLSD